MRQMKKKMFLLLLSAVTVVTAWAQDARTLEALKLLKESDQEILKSRLPDQLADEPRQRALAWKQFFESFLQEAAFAQSALKYRHKTPGIDSVAMYDKMCVCIVEAANAANECYKYDTQPDSSGKIKPRYHYPLRTAGLQLIDNLNQVAAHFLTAKSDTIGAQRALDLYLEMTEQPIFQYEEITNQGQVRNSILRFSTILAWNRKQYFKALGYARELKESGNEAEKMFATQIIDSIMIDD